MKAAALATITHRPQGRFVAACALVFSQSVARSMGVMPAGAYEPSCECQWQFGCDLYATPPGEDSA